MKLNNKIIIACSSHARVGKDTLCQILTEKFAEKGLKAQRVALADPLKQAVRQEVLDTYQIDVLNCSPEQKSIIRPFLVLWGKQRREETEGTYFTNLAQQIIDSSNSDVIIVTDIRYAVYPKDEVFWVKNQGGRLIYLERELEDGSIVPPANEDEAFQIPIIARLSDYTLKWKTAPIDQLKDLPEVNEIFNNLINILNK